MNIRVTTGGIIEKDGKFLLVQENKEKCKGKWNIPAGGLKADENILECVKRELFEETGCKVKITGLIEILNGVYEGINVVSFFFDTKLIEENISVDGKEISNANWFSYEEIINMKDNLRAGGYFLDLIKKKLENKIWPLDVINFSNEEG